MKKLVAILLSLLAIVLIVMGIGNFMIPPALTGIGFLALAFVFFKEGQHKNFDK
ncbi:hypothetical protein SAMN05192553_102447 [Cyclobacterium xiamenense]|jgi:uncharacterized membrane protein|uniref:Uncharacterized protein n=1 Tax=Cyclobacterium xiamenense TaxID=1297121 RepID=A0A1H6W6I3_9BACT|nr:hypothetical protein [Cyclobacterium xiamenense]SEJ11386.1 hypothetical protein SAMN05192553_102447 [Cyclobacterium xiamenense]